MIDLAINYGSDADFHRDFKNQLQEFIFAFRFLKYFYEKYSGFFRKLCSNKNKMP